jgi:3-deoxy-D-manno-octulosonic acid kinase
MAGVSERLPAGFVRFTSGGADVVCAEKIEPAVRDAMTSGSLYSYAKSHPDARALEGRGVAFAVPLPGNVERVVVRHNRHGGLFAPITGDLFTPPTRAPYELRIAERLRSLGVATPRMLGYVIYRAGPFRRADVFTREVVRSSDLAVSLASERTNDRAAALVAAAHLVRGLSACGAHHQDLNVKNILLHRAVLGALEALVIDVDRVTLDTAPADALELNLARLLRSAKKWQSQLGARVTDVELDTFVALARAANHDVVSTFP